jgi:hypothetical protein
LTEDLGKQNICALFVPHALSDNEKHARVEHCKDMLRSAKNDTNFTNSIVTGDETWCFQYEFLAKPKPKKGQCTLAISSSEAIGSMFA